MHKKERLYMILALVLLSAGCESILLTGAGGGIGYTITNIAYKTVGYPIGEVESAMHKALQRMDIKELSVRKKESDVEIEAETKELKIYIDIQWITTRTTRIKVDARENVILKDKATATAIIEQTETILSRASETH